MPRERWVDRSGKPPAGDDAKKYFELFGLTDPKTRRAFLDLCELGMARGLKKLLEDRDPQNSEQYDKQSEKVDQLEKAFNQKKDNDPHFKKAVRGIHEKILEIDNKISANGITDMRIVQIHRTVILEKVYRYITDLENR